MACDSTGYSSSLSLINVRKELPSEPLKKTPIFHFMGLIDSSLDVFETILNIIAKQLHGHKTQLVNSLCGTGFKLGENLTVGFIKKAPLCVGQINITRLLFNVIIP